MVETPRATQRVKRPSITLMYLVLLSRAILGLLVTCPVVVLIARASERVGGLPVLLALLLAAVGVVYLLAALLVRRYKRRGLYLSLILAGIDLLLTVIGFFATREALSGRDMLQVAQSVLVVYFAYQYLTQEPDKSFFN